MAERVLVDVDTGIGREFGYRDPLTSWTREEIDEGLRRARVARSLSAREIGVLRLVAKGLSNDEIAGRLYISASTVKTYLVRLSEKLGASGDRANAVAVGYEIGLLRPGDAREEPDA